MAIDANNLTIISLDRKIEANTPGSLYILEKYIKEQNINIESSDIMATMPLYLLDFTERQQTVFKGYYWKQMSMYDIKVQCGFKYLSEVERSLKSATKRYLKMLKADYGTK